MTLDFSAMAELTRLTIADIPINLQIAICIFLRPIDILALRKVCLYQYRIFWLLKSLVNIIKTCKAFELTTWRRVVWLAAFHRVCLDNALFLPSFSVLDMTILELEQAAMAPHRWIELCSAFEKRHLGEPGAIFCPQTTELLGIWTCGPRQVFFSYQADDMRWSLRLNVFSFWIWATFQMSIAR